MNREIHFRFDWSGRGKIAPVTLDRVVANPLNQTDSEVVFYLDQ
ncbi:hypothetical protein AXFE_17340 [Acidithrix ferrooxidans]|uniref:Uncharacterized protein n=1 Tax=Acidithrix ferrooxidans TaxID=1280514 RepID=A0A0D8HI30_9ACTN|nr:hypothetical protein AXFE_17340 [Acidithrix ferrooxidans]CAG4913192.1 unnamed protein product [Acidithrix sp. C25]